jgi:hypothetical protein
MYPTLILGLVTLVVAARFTWLPERRRLGFVAALWLTTFAQIVHATLTDIGTVLHALVNIDPEHRTKAMFEGFKECTRPGIMGGVFLILALLFVAIGLNRAAQNAEA